MGRRRQRVPRTKVPSERTIASGGTTRRAASDIRSYGALLAAFVLATTLAYLPALQGGFIWDDDAYVTQNLALRSVDGLRGIWFQPGATPQYYPLVHTTFWLEYHLWGLQPFGFHLVNVLLHTGTAFLVWLVLRRLEVPGALFVAAVFALHPVHVESVAWITERKNVLSGLLYTASLLVYLRFAGIGTVPTSGRARDYRLALLLFAAALLSKTVVASLPAAILLIVWWKRGRLERRDLVPLVPFFVLGLALGLTTLYVEKHHVGAKGMDWALSPLQRVLIAGRALWFYAQKLVWPSTLTFIYPRWTIDPRSALAYVPPVAALGVIAALWWRRAQLGRGPLVAVLFFAGTLVPALGFFDVYPMRYSFVADHFQYLASLGILTLLGAAAARGATTLPRHVTTGAAVVTVALLGGSTFGQSRVYKDQETLWRDTLAKNPGAWMAYHNLGGILEQKGRDEEAMAAYRQALRLKPDHADVHNNMGNILARQGRVDDAIASYRESLRLLPEQPEAHSNLGVALAGQGRFDDATAHYREALRQRPHFASAHINLGNALVQQGRPAEALASYEIARAIDPDDASAHYNLGNALLAVGRRDEAIAALHEALRRRPGYAKAQAALTRAQAQGSQLETR
jgi:protein O-mannosyl-transferase